MKYILLLSMAFFAVDSCFAQDTVRHFIAFDGKTKCKPAQGYYYRVAIKEGEWWKVKDYYCQEKTLYKDGIYKNCINDSFQNAIGMFVYFHPNKTLMKKVRYINDKKEGVVKEYDSVGQLIDSAYYKNDILSKARHKWENNTLTFKGVYNDIGIGEEWYYDDGILRGHGKTSENAKKDSTWVFYYENGRTSSIEHYRQDSLLSAECFDETGKKLDSCKIDVMPQAPYDVNEFLAQNMIYPDNAREHNIEGKVQVIFWVDIDGRIIHPFARTGSADGGLQEEAIRVVSKMPKWKPGTRRGKPVRVLYTLPISFRLG